MAEALGTIASVIAVTQIAGKVLELCVKYYPAVKNARAEVKRVQAEVEDLSVTLEDLKDLLQGHAGNTVAATQKLSDAIGRAEKELGSLKKKLSLPPGQNNMKPFGLRALKWPFKEGEVNSVVESLGNIKETFILALQIDQTDFLVKVKQEVDTVANQVHNVSQSLINHSTTTTRQLGDISGATTKILDSHNQSSAKADQKLDDITSGINNMSTLANLNKLFDSTRLPFASGATYDSRAEGSNPTCLPGTRTKILDRILTWAAEEDGKCIFWLSGRAGTGKSTIARTVARSLSHTSRTLGATFFFKRTEADRSSANKFFTTIASQLARSFPDVRPAILKVIEEEPLIADKELVTQFKDLILKPIQDLNQNLRPGIILIFVIDALDECSSEQDIRAILSLFTHWKDLKPITLRLFITSRPELPIRMGFNEMLVELYHTEALQELPKQDTIHDLRIFFRHRFGEIRKNANLPPDWPHEDEIEKLVDLAVPLFIFAATACRYIEDRRHNPQRRLQRYLENVQNRQASSLKDIYSPVLSQLLDEDDDENDIGLARFREIVGTIILLETPISVNSLSKLIQLPVTDIIHGVNNLHSVLDVPTNFEMPIRTFHLSFRDFLLDRERKVLTPFSIDEKERHLWITIKCLELLSMDNNLHENMCNLQSPGTERSEIPVTEVERLIPEHVRYACRYWFDHFRQSEARVETDDAMHHFLKTHLLHWLEVMGLLGAAAECLAVIENLHSLVQGMDQKLELVEFIVDARRFTREYIWIIDNAPLQLYSSALLFSPQNSLVRHSFQDILSGLFTRSPHWHRTGCNLCTTIDIDGERPRRFRTFIEYSPTGNQLATVHESGEVRLWSTATTSLQQTLFEEDGAITAIAFSNNGLWVATLNEKGTVKLWDLLTGIAVDTLRFKSVDCYGGRCIAFVPQTENTLLVAERASHGGVNILNFPGGQVLQTFRETDLWHPLKFSADTKQLAISQRSYYCTTIVIWQIGSYAKRFHYPRDTYWSFEPFALSFAPNGNHFAICRYRDPLMVWDICSGERALTTTESDYKDVTYSPDGLHMGAVRCEGVVDVWNISSVHGRERDQVIAMHYHHLFSLRVDPVNRELTLLTFSPDGRKLALLPRTCGLINIWDLATLDAQQSINNIPPSTDSYEISPTGQLLVVSVLQRAELWNVSTGFKVMDLDFSNLPVLDLWFGDYLDWKLSFDGSILAGHWKDSQCFNTKLWFWDCTTGKPLHRGEHFAEVLKLEWSPNNLLLASVAVDEEGQWVDGRSVTVWDMKTGERMHEFSHDRNLDPTLCGTMRFSQDSRFLASATDRQVYLFDLLAAQMVWTLTHDFGDAPTLSFSADNRRIIRCDLPTGTIVYDVESGDELPQSTPNTSGEATGAFSLHLPTSFKRRNRTPRVSRSSDSWVCRDKRKLLWIPPEHRDDVAGIYQNRLIFGPRDGHVSYIDFL